MRIVPALKLNGDVAIYIEVRDGPEVLDPHEEPVSTLPETEAGAYPAETIADAIAHVCRTVHTRVMIPGTENSAPGDLSIEFGLTFARNVKVPIITEGSNQGMFKVIARWSKPPNLVAAEATPARSGGRPRRAQ